MNHVCLSSMAVLLENVTNCVWHAFSALQQDKSGLVNKSKLKVLTANIGTLLDLYGVERGLEHYRSTNTLNFDHFKYYLLHEVFSCFPDKLALTELREYETRIAEVCWLVCRSKYLPRENRIFSDDSVFQLFRIFCLLAELTPDTQENTYQVLLNSSEAETIAQTLASSLGCSWDVNDFTNLCTAIGSFRLGPFIAVLESRCLGEVSDAVAISEAVADMHETFVDDVIKKGILLKKGYLLPTMREFWVILRPSELVYYKSRSEKDRCGSLPIEPGSKVEARSGYKIVLQTPERSFELAATDHMTRLQWVSALQLAVEYSGGTQSYQRLQAERRRQQRAGRAHEIQRARAQLQRERTARQAAEGQARELEAVAREEAKRLAELEHIRGRLERLLEEETQAKRDEEIVRALQARVLAEEWEKREELERLQEEQKVLLEEERSKRVEFEQQQREIEVQLRNAEKRLEQLEDERKSLDEQLRTAHFKIKLSEESKDILEVKLRNMTPNVREGDRVRRAHSFMPSTKERPVMLEVRSSTLRRPTKQ